MGVFTCICSLGCGAAWVLAYLWFTEKNRLVSPSSACYLDVRCIFSPVLFCENIDVMGTVPLESWEGRWPGVRRPEVDASSPALTRCHPGRSCHLIRCLVALISWESKSIPSPEFCDAGARCRTEVTRKEEGWWRACVWRGAREAGGESRGIWGRSGEGKRVHAKERLSAGRWSRKTTWAAPSVVTRSVVTRRDQTLLASQVWGRPWCQTRGLSEGQFCWGAEWDQALWLHFRVSLTGAFGVRGI